MKRVQIVALISIAILLAAVVFAPVPGATRWLRTVHNSAHAPIFGCVALLCLAVFRSHVRFSRFSAASHYSLALAAAALLGILTEIAQMFVGRDAEVDDAVNDTLGAAAFLAIFALFDPRLRSLPKQRSMRIAAVVIAIGALMFTAQPITRAAIKYEQRDRRFPVLADFSSDYDRYFIMQKSAEFSRAQLPKPWATASDEGAMRVRLFDGAYPGMDFIEISPDWSGYRTLAIDLTNPTPLTLRLVLRVHDAAHNNQPSDRFSRRIEVPPGRREVIRIPLEEIAAGPQQRRLDLHQVAGVIVFRTDDSPPVPELFFSKLWLEK